LAEVIRLVALAFGAPAYILGDLAASRVIAIGPGFLLLLLGLVVLPVIAIRGLQGSYQAETVRASRKWTLIGLGIPIILYFILFSLLHIGDHPQYGPIKTRLYGCQENYLSCDIDVGDRYDLVRRQRPLAEDVSSICADCRIEGTFVLPEHEYPWLQVTMYLYAYVPGSDGAQVALNDKIVFTVENGVREVNFSLGNEWTNAGYDFKLLTLVYYGYYRVMDGTYEGADERGYGVPEHVRVIGEYVKTDPELLYSGRGLKAREELLAEELKAKLATDMTQEERDYLGAYVRLEGFEHNAGPGVEDPTFHRTLSGKIANTGNRTINLALLTVTYDSGEERSYVIANAREINKYQYRVFPANKMSNFLYWDFDTVMNLREVDIDDPAVQKELHLEAISARIEKIFFDW
jgi:hypothetical protein